MLQFVISLCTSLSDLINPSCILESLMRFLQIHRMERNPGIWARLNQGYRSHWAAVIAKRRGAALCQGPKKHISSNKDRDIPINPLIMKPNKVGVCTPIKCSCLCACWVPNLSSVPNGPKRFEIPFCFSRTQSRLLFPCLGFRFPYNPLETKKGTLFIPR